METNSAEGTSEEVPGVLQHLNEVTTSLAEHTAAWERYARTELNATIDTTDKENRFTEAWQKNHYFAVGAEALRHSMAALLVNRRPLPSRILDFPCGSGRVTRHLRAMFPDAEIGACDLYSPHIDFCASQFDAVPILSRENLNELDVGLWDLIFCGSLLTHLPDEQFRQSIDFMARSLSPSGIAIVTLEGRHSVHIQDHKWKLIDDERFAVARAGFDREGFGFVDYAHAFRSENFGEQQSYGVTLAKPSHVMGILEARDDIAILGFQERAWDDHQDIVIFGKPGVND
jgi:SAM-dependent methyltransferase